MDAQGLHTSLRAGGTPRPPFPPGALDLSDKVLQGGKGTGFWECSSRLRSLTPSRVLPYPILNLFLALYYGLTSYLQSFGLK